MSDLFDEADFLEHDNEIENVYVEFTEVKHMTENAILFSFGSNEEENLKEVWIPKSLCHIVGENIAEIPEWLVTERELDYFVCPFADDMVEDGYESEDTEE